MICAVTVSLPDGSVLIVVGVYIANASGLLFHPYMREGLPAAVRMRLS